MANAVTNFVNAALQLPWGQIGPFAISAIALYYAHRADRRASENDTPAVSIDVRRYEIWPGWYIISLGFINKTQHEWRVRWIEVTPFKRCKAVTREDAKVRTDFGGVVIEREKAEKTAKHGRIGLGFQLRPGDGNGDLVTDKGQFKQYVFAKIYTVPTMVNIRVEMLCLGTSRRRQIVQIKHFIPG